VGLTAAGAGCLLPHHMRPARARNYELVARFDRWLLLQKYSPVTRDMYTRAMREYVGFFGDTSVIKSTHLDVQEFLAAQAAKGVLPRTVLYKLYAVRVFFDFLCLGGLIRWSPSRVVQMRKVGRRAPAVLTVDQVKHVFRAARTPHERALVEVLYGTGCRTAEVANMLIEDIDFAKRRIRVHGKAGTRYVFFADRVGKALRRYIDLRQTGYVFVEVKPLQNFRPSPQTSSRGAWSCRWKKYDRRGRVRAVAFAYIPARKRMSYQEAWAYFARLGVRDRPQRPIGARPLCHAAIQKAIQRIGLRAGVVVNPRNFRHTFATHLLDNGADLRIVQELLGHTSIRSTQIYTHVSKAMLRRAFDEFHPDIGGFGV
jgi:site-specific recombinase XerD